MDTSNLSPTGQRYFNDLMALQLPVLEAMLATHIKLIDNALTVANGRKDALLMNVAIIGEKNAKTTKQFCFPEPETIPEEFKTAFHDYATRLCGERWMIDTAVQIKKAAYVKQLAKNL
jgi:hypothetical protein